MSSREAAVTCLAIGDPHFKVSNVRETEQMCAALIKLAKERQPDFIVVLGDVLDRHEAIHVVPLRSCVEFLRGLMEVAPVIVLVGNHDRPNNSDFLSPYHPFTALKGWGERMKIVETTWESSFGGLDFVFVPYVPPGRFFDALNWKPDQPSEPMEEGVENWKNASAIFAHQEFKGAKMGAIISEVGDPWPVNAPMVISGHIHDFQEVQPNLLYVGTPIQHAFGDTEDKTVSWFSFTKGEQPHHERIDLALPKKVIVRLTCAEVLDYTAPHNREIKMIISGQPSDLKAIRKHPKVAQWRKEGIRVVYRDIVAAPTTAPVPWNGRAMSYASALYEAVQTQEPLRLLYHELFGRPSDVRQVSPQGKRQLVIVG